jgi:acyl-CoA thioesterase-1
MPIRCFLLPALLLGLFGCTRNEDTAQPVPPPIPAAEPARPPDTRPVIVAFGDSLTAGYGVESGQGWPEILQGMLDQKSLAYRVVNQGISGDTTSGGLARVSAAVSLNPKAVILELGANDGLRGLPVASTEENLSRMIEQFQKSGAKVLLAGITLPRNYGPDYIRDFDRVYPALAKKYKTAYLPFLMEGVALDPKLMQQDALHPNAEGHRKMAALVWKYLEPLLE